VNKGVSDSNGAHDGQITDAEGTVALPPLTETQHEYLEHVRAGLSLAADLHRSDLFIYVPDQAGHLVVYAHAQPHSMASLYRDNQTGRLISVRDQPVVHRVLASGGSARDQRSLLKDGAPIQQNARALRAPDGTLAGVLLIETNLMEAHRLKLRARAFRVALGWIRDMLVEGRLGNVAHLSPFGEVDGLVLVDSARVIRYISGRGSGIYRRLGFLGDLRGQALRHLGNEDNRLVLQAMTTGAPLEVEVEEREHFLIKSVVPLSTFWSAPGCA